MPQTAIFEKLRHILDTFQTEYCKDILVLVSNIPMQIRHKY